jgi:hypothetical protein
MCGTAQIALATGARLELARRNLTAWTETSPCNPGRQNVWVSPFSVREQSCPTERAANIFVELQCAGKLLEESPQMSMSTMRGYRPKDDPLYPGQLKVISRLGFWQSSSNTGKSKDGATPDESPLATNRRAGPDRRVGPDRRERFCPPSTADSDPAKMIGPEGRGIAVSSRGEAAFCRKIL